MYWWCGGNQQKGVDLIFRQLCRLTGTVAGIIQRLVIIRHLPTIPSGQDTRVVEICQPREPMKVAFATLLMVGDIYNRQNSDIHLAES